jgi:hypothetical protein
VVDTSTTPMSQGCVGTPCELDVARIADVEPGTSCLASQTPNFSAWLCTGSWATVGVGGAARVCTIQLLPTALVRYSVSCGACVTIVTLN